ncbi:probable cardiolipin synthase (CMP-forming) [Saccostrea echinata]|uniref:probable cardiolipin synthase (CMP-forming) n=1 Tax=Saccostrea echinata TaxID=191078 RepID=UPI002A8284A5|nr:probable cardiolipin synthase (CMP-forming) [Saccostrea echinata]
MLCRHLNTLTLRPYGFVRSSILVRQFCCTNVNKNCDSFTCFKLQKCKYHIPSNVDLEGFRRHFSSSCWYCCRKSDKDDGRRKESIQPLQGESIKTIPNIITTCRIISAPFLGYMVTHGQFEMALGLFIIAGITDLLDGYIARNFKGQMSSFGTFLDPLADKVMMTVMFTTLSMAHIVPVPLTVIVVGRDVFLIAAAFYIRYISIKPPVNMKNFFDVSNASVSLHPSTLSKYNTTLQLILVASALTAQVMGWPNHQALQAL